MPNRPRRAGVCRRRSNKALRCGVVIGVGGAAGAFVASALTSLTAAPTAHADIEDLIVQPIVDAVSQAASAIDPSTFDAALDAGSLTAPAAATDIATATDVSAPLSLYDTTEPVTELSVNGGSVVPALVDTGSDGLVIPWQDLGLETFNFFPVDAGIGAYSGGLDYFYLTFDLPLDIGGVSTTSPVDVELFSFPTTFQSYFQPDGVDAVLGIGPNAVGPGPSDFTSSLPGGGVFIDEQTGTLEFGANPDAPGDITVGGAPDATLNVSVSVPGGGTASGAEEAIIDSGGVYGTIPSSLAPDVTVGDTLPVGSVVSVSNGDQLLYSYDVTNADDSPTVVSGSTFDTGYYPFEDGPIYINTSGDETVFDYTPAAD